MPGEGAAGRVGRGDWVITLMTEWSRSASPSAAAGKRSRLVLIAAAVAIGVCLLPATFAGTNAVNSSIQRQLWFNTGAAARTETASVAPLWWWGHTDHFDGKHHRDGRRRDRRHLPRSPQV
jgi:hypothetical protein